MAKKKTTKKRTKKTKKAAKKKPAVRRKIRKDCTVKTLRKKYGLDFVNDDGKHTRSDKKVATIRKGK